MPDERRQFRILYRDFLLRMIDLEVIAGHGDIQKLLGQLGAVLAGLSFVMAFVMVPGYTNFRQGRQRLLIASWGDQEFLIATTIGVVGLFAVIAWNAVLPDRRDSLVLGPLPVRIRTILAAKVAAIGTALGISIAAVNVFVGLSLPFLISPGGDALSGLHSFAAYWITMIAAGVFVFSSLLAVQGVAAQLLSYRLFLRVSGILQLMAFFLVLGVYFLTPALATAKGLSAPANQRLLAWLPSYWFLGLFQELNGGLTAATQSLFGPLADRAARNTLLAGWIAAGTYGLAYIRHMKRVVEQADIAPGDRSATSVRIGSLIARKLFADPLDRAICLFTARTIARSRHHRLLLAAYAGVGLAIALAFAKSLIYGYSREPWNRLNAPLLSGGLVLMIFACSGTRAVFALPMALPSNWIFRITAIRTPQAYFGAVKKSLYVLAAAPVWVASAIYYFAIWPLSTAFEQVLVLAALAVIIVERALYRFRKVPFTCSYLPGGSNLTTKLGIYAIVFLLSTGIGIQLEFVSMQKPLRFAVLLGIVITIALWMRRRTCISAASPYNAIQFEELPPAAIHALELHRDGV